jgi:Glucan phosphorylase
MAVIEEFLVSCRYSRRLSTLILGEEVMLRFEHEILFTPCPERIARLRELAYNLWWTWHPEAQDLYRSIDPELWELVYHNPVEFLRDVRQRKLEAAANDPAYLKRYDAVLRA